MSIENQIQALTDALNANTAAIMGNGSAGGITSSPGQAIPPGTVVPPPPAQPAAPAPVMTAAVLHTPAAAAQPAAGYPSDAAPAAAPAQAAAAPAAAQAVPPSTAAVGPAEITLDDVKQEVSALYQRLNGDQRINGIVSRYGATLSAIEPVQYGNLLNELRAL